MVETQPKKQGAQQAERNEEDLPEMIVKEGEDIDYRIVLVAYLLMDLGKERIAHLSSSAETFASVALVFGIHSWMVSHFCPSLVKGSDV